MPRNLEPGLVALPLRLERGAIVSLPDPKAGKTAEGIAEILRFQYNPETVTRTRTGQWEHRLDKKGKITSAQAKAEMDNHRGGGLKAKSEMISLKLIFDATELMLRSAPPSANAAPADGSQVWKTGVLPELAVLERLALGPDQVPEPKKDDSEYPLISLNPSEVLFVLGPRRFPAVITSLTIVEQRFNPQLVPVRAEVDLRLRVLEATKSASNTVVGKAFEELQQARKTAAGEATELVSGAGLHTAIMNAFAPAKTGGKP